MKLPRELGPGLLESVYEITLAKLLVQSGIPVQRQVRVPIDVLGLHFEDAFRADLVVGAKVIVEIKSIETLKNVHKKQLLTYLRLTGMKLGLLLNFGQALLKDGIVRIVNGLPD